MNTKTSYKWSHNFYDGGNHAVGRDSPGALLDMLAEVASRTLHSETISLENDSSAKIKRNKVERRKNQDVCLDLPQILSMPQNQLVKHFSVFTSDELKRQYSYACALVPGCQQKYTSFASEGKARLSITTHLVDHLDHLKNNKDFYETFRASAVKYAKPKSGVQGKKAKSQQCGKQKSNEIPNKENKLAKQENPTSYLRKILCNEMNFKEFEREKKLEEEDNRQREKWKIDDHEKLNGVVELKVLGDHSYYEHVKGEPNQNANVIDHEAISDSVTLMVVENEDKSINEEHCISDNITGQSNLENNLDHSETTTITAKPKGKAKFIGTSKEEREMAIILMERIKKKGNPTGSNLQCKICDPPRTFTAPTTLVSHYRSHAGIKPYECRICRSAFTRRHSLKYHMLIHQNQTRFTCADCGKKFRHPSHFREHRRRHTGESPFGCDDCGQRFKTRNTYKRHLKTRHGKVLTTTGELLCLTEEEFQKVQTNRKRKTSSISSENMADEDATAAGTIVQFVGQVFTSEMNHQEIDGGSMDMEDYVMKDEIFDSSNARRDTGIDVNKTETIETELRVENDGYLVDNEEEEGSEKILYDGIVVEDQLFDSPIDGREEFIDDESSVMMLENSTINNNENNVKIEYENSETATLTTTTTTTTTTTATTDVLGDCDNSNEQVVREDDEYVYLPTGISQVTKFCNDVDYSRNNLQEMVKAGEQNGETRVNVQYAYEIHENVREYELTAQQIVAFDDNECGSMIDGSIVVHNNNNVKEEASFISDGSVESQHSLSTRRNIEAPMAKSAFLVITDEDMKVNYLRIENEDILVKEVAPLPSIAVPQK